MKVLIVEDDQNKLMQLTDYITKALDDPSIIQRRSYQSGLKEVMSNPYSLIILDMSMPTFDISPQASGGRTRVFGGRDILRQMARRGIDVPVIVVTQFEMFGDVGKEMTLQVLSDELGRLFTNYLGTVYYNAALNNWKDDLDRFLAEAIHRSYKGE